MGKKLSDKLKNITRSKAMPEEKFQPQFSHQNGTYSNISPQIWPPQHPSYQQPPPSCTQLAPPQMQPNVSHVALPQPQFVPQHMTHQAAPQMHTQTMNTCPLGQYQAHLIQPAQHIQHQFHQLHQQHQHQQHQQNQPHQQQQKHHQQQTTPNQQLNMSNGGYVSKVHNQIPMQHVAPAIHQPQQQPPGSQAPYLNPMPTYPNNLLHSTTNQTQQQLPSTRYVDNNSHYCNSNVAALGAQQQNHQQQQQVYQHQFSSEPFQQPDQLEKAFDGRLRQDQQQTTHIHQNDQSQHQIILPEQQQYQNHPMVGKIDTNGRSIPDPIINEDASTEFRCKVYRKHYHELMEEADKLRADLSKLNEAISNGIISNGKLGPSKAATTPYKSTTPSQANGTKDVQALSVVERFELKL